MASDTKQRLLEQGIAMLLEQGYHNLGVAGLLEATGIPKGSFYYYFKSKEGFGIEVIDLYMQSVDGALDYALGDMSKAPLQRIRYFFELVEKSYQTQGYLGCLLGGLGQELSGVSASFQKKVEACFSKIADRFQICLDEARKRGELPEDSDSRQLAELLVNCWEGAALRSRIRRNPSPLGEMLDFYFSAITKRSEALL
jgi:TetR/AcrR family transcriptional regulator, transcriptional repressor for nem operon